MENEVRDNTTTNQDLSEMTDAIETNTATAESPWNGVQQTDPAGDGKKVRDLGGFTADTRFKLAKAILGWVLTQENTGNVINFNAKVKEYFPDATEDQYAEAVAVARELYRWLTHGEYPACKVPGVWLSDRREIRRRVDELSNNVVEHLAYQNPCQWGFKDMNAVLRAEFPNTEPAILELVCEHAVKKLDKRIANDTERRNTIKKWLDEAAPGPF
jgi:hypothetical protein